MPSRIWRVPSDVGRGIDEVTRTEGFELTKLAFDRVVRAFWRLMKGLHVCTDLDLSARACVLIQEAAFRMTWAEGLALHGLAGSRTAVTRSSAPTIIVMTAGPVVSHMEEYVTRRAAKVNLRYGTRFRVHVLDWSAFRSENHIHLPVP